MRQLGFECEKKGRLISKNIRCLICFGIRYRDIFVNVRVLIPKKEARPERKIAANNNVCGFLFSKGKTLPTQYVLSTRQTAIVCAGDVLHMTVSGLNIREMEKIVVTIT